jgi:hypothetical protein
MSDSDLTWAAEAISAHIALTWTVHQWKIAQPGADTPLDCQILEFSARALDEASRLFPIFESVTAELRWLILFKGLIAAESHPRDMMLNAIDAIRKRQNTVMELPPQKAIKRDGHYGVDPRSEALAAIASALSSEAPAPTGSSLRNELKDLWPKLKNG